MTEAALSDFAIGIRLGFAPCHSRGTARQRELAVRQALGASRAQLVRLLFAENAILASVATCAGLGIAFGLVRGLVALAPATLPRLDLVGLDVRTVAFAGALALLTPVVFGLWPAWQLSRQSARATLSDGGRLGSGAAHTRTRLGLVAVEVAVAVVLVAAAGLLARSLMHLLAVDPGFEPDHVLTVQTTVPEGRYGEPSAAARLYDQWLARASAVPGVAAVGLVNAPPLSGMDANGGFLLDGQVWEAIRGNWTAQSAVYRVASRDYFAAMGMTVLRGRTFGARDVAGGEPVAVVNEALVRSHFAGRSPLGHRLRFAGMDADNPWLTIVGVVGDTRFADLGREAAPEVFVDFRQLSFRTRYAMAGSGPWRSGCRDSASTRC